MIKKSVPLSKVCLCCKNIYYKKVNQSKKDWLISKYCSRNCKDKYLIGKPTWNTGLKIDRKKYPNFGHFQKHTKSALLKIIRANKINAKKITKDQRREWQKLSTEIRKKKHNYFGTLGRVKELSFVWKGNKATYNTKHRWIQKHWIKTGVCQNCGSKPKIYGKRKWGTEWHNLDGAYNREDKKTWLELCPKCHHGFNKQLCQTQDDHRI